MSYEDTNGVVWEENREACAAELGWTMSRWRVEARGLWDDTCAKYGRQQAHAVLSATCMELLQTDDGAVDDSAALRMALDRVGKPLRIALAILFGDAGAHLEKTNTAGDTT